MLCNAIADLHLRSIFERNVSPLPISGTRRTPVRLKNIRSIHLGNILKLCPTLVTRHSYLIWEPRRLNDEGQTQST